MMPPERGLSDEAIIRKLDMLDRLIASASVKDLPALNAAYNRLISEQTRRDIEGNQ